MGNRHWDGSLDSDELDVLKDFLFRIIIVLGLDMACGTFIRFMGITSVTLAALCALFVAPYWCVHSTVVLARFPKILIVIFYGLAIATSFIPVFTYLTAR